MINKTIPNAYATVSCVLIIYALKMMNPLLIVIRLTIATFVRMFNEVKDNYLQELR